MNFGGPSGSLPSTGQHHFSELPVPRIGRSKFDRSHTRKMTFDSGYLVPFFVDRVYPGDTMTMSATIFARLATPEVPIMDNIYCETFFIYGPDRILMTNFNRLLGERDPNPDSSTDYLLPIATAPAGGYAFGSLQDHLGLRPGVAGYTHVNMPCRLYNKAWNYWFRDENLQDSVTVDMDDGPDTVTDYTLLRRGKRHDYFTSALPWPQKGDAVTMSLGSTAPIITNPANSFPLSAAAQPDIRLSTTGNLLASLQTLQGSAAGVFEIASGTDAFYDPGTTLVADLTNATASTINVLRSSIALQQLLERDARSGTRAKEIINGHFGVVVPDYRLSQPEYLGGGSERVTMFPIPQTSESGAGTPQANLAATGVLAMKGHGFTKSFVEHGWVLGLLAVRADLTYQQGLPRWAFLRSREELYWPDFANLGEQAILNKEIFVQGTSADDQVFGYQERFAELRYKPNEITGILRSDAPASLDVWHMAEDFAALPVLGDTFIQDAPPIERSVAVTSEPEFIADIAMKYICARPLPVRSIPGLNRL